MNLFSVDMKQAHEQHIRFGDHLTQLRKAAGLTQVQLAETLGLTQQYVAKWEANDRPPSSKLLPKLAKAFDVSVEEVLNVKPEHPSKKRGPPSRGHKLIDQVDSLPPRYRDKIYDVVSALLDQYGRAA